MIEIELPDPSMKVPEGLKFAVAHFLTVPEERYRNVIEGDNHQHHIVKIAPRPHGGDFVVKKFGAFTRVDDKFSFETEDLKNQSLCHLTTGWFGGEYPHCKHGSVQTFLVGWKEHICPHATNALDLYLVCHSKQSDSIEGRKILRNLTFKHDITPGQKFQIVTILGSESKPLTFSFLELCKENGMKKLRTIQSSLEVDCKQNPQPINFLIYRLKNKEGEKEELVKEYGDYIQQCEHDEECKIKKTKQNNFSPSSQSHPLLPVSSVYIDRSTNIHESNVANVGSDGQATVSNQQTN